jgi:hypothetical protein
MSTHFENRLLETITTHYDELLAPTATRPAMPSQDGVRAHRRVRPAILVGGIAAAAAAALVAGVVAGTTVHDAAPSAEPSHAVAAPHFASPKLLVAAAVTAVTDSTTASAATMTNSDGSATTWYTDDAAGIETTVYTDPSGAVVKRTGMRTDPTQAGQLQLITVDDQARTWASTTIGGTIAPPSGSFLDLAEANTQNGKATVTGHTTIDGTPATVLVLSAPDGSDPATFYLDSRTLLPLKSTGPAGSPDVDYHYSAALPDAGSWPTPPAGYTQTAWDYTAFKNR